ncbi:DHH family phosphoesterase, partial [Salmonella enterica]|uniref:DHH family phosphoesterase n=1 Tax=Salmonella enterica TaxID=28901 RepID=UPI0032992923
MIITDHHEPQSELPHADAILNPKQHDCPFPFDQLAGVGVAFFLVMALRKAFTEQGLVDGSQINLKKHLDLVALGT